MATLEEAAARAEEVAPGYLARIRRAAGARRVPTDARSRVARAVELVDRTAEVDADAPLESNRLAGRVLKAVVSRLIRFYALYVTNQVTELGVSVSWMGRALADYTAGLEAEVTALRSEVADLRRELESVTRGKPA